MSGGKGGGGAAGGGGYNAYAGDYGQGGGGGGGAGGGTGGAGGGGPGAPGGAGGTAASRNGQAGTANYTSDGLGLGGGGGGGGGYNGNGKGSVLGTSSSVLRGGAGGAGGYGYYGGGGGGAGGYGAVSRDANGAQVSIKQQILGGVGGAGGKDAFLRGGDGGDGGVGLYVVNFGVVVTNTALIRGGNGGVGGASSNKYGGNAGRGGYGLVGENMTIKNAATIQGGAGGAGGQAGVLGGKGGAGIEGFGLKITNSGTVRGGAGGRDGASGSTSNEGLTGPAGNGITGSHLSITNSGLISGAAPTDQPGGLGISGDHITINNQSGGTIRGLHDEMSSTGEAITGTDLTIVNNGMIDGSVQFGGGTNSLTLGGTVKGGIAVADGATLVFKSSGTLSNEVSVNSGTLAAAAGVAVTFSGDVAGHSIVLGAKGATGSFSFASGSGLYGDVLFAAGKVTFGAGATIGATSLDIDGGAVGIAAFQSYNGTFKLDAGYLNLGANNFTSTESTDFEGGTVTGSGKLTVGATTKLHATTVFTGTTTLIDGGSFAASAGLSLRTGADLLVNAKGKYALYGNASIGAQTANDTITNQGVIYKTGGGKSFVTGAITNTGTIETISGTLDLTKNVSGTGKLVLQGTSTLELGGIIAAGQTTTFGAGNDTLKLDSAANFHATIAGFGSGDAITLTGFSDMAKVLYEASSDTLSVTDGSRHFSTHLDGSYQARNFNLTHVTGGEAIHYGGPN